jgi:hypothetical protein
LISRTIRGIRSIGHANLMAAVGTAAPASPPFIQNMCLAAHPGTMTLKSC